MSRTAIGRWKVPAGKYALRVRAAEINTGKAISTAIDFKNPYFQKPYDKMRESTKPKSAWPGRLAAGVDVELTVTKGDVESAKGDIWDNVFPNCPTKDREVSFSLRTSQGAPIAGTETPARIQLGQTGGMDLRITGT